MTEPIIVDLSTAGPTVAGIGQGPPGPPGPPGESGAAAALELAGDLLEVSSSAADLEDATSTFLAAASAAKAAGKRVLRVPPGTYVVPGLHPDDIEGLYVVGDGVRLVGDPIPNVYPFSTAEYAQNVSHSTIGVTGRGVVAFQVDDGLALHWSRLFPLTKELGITVGSAWHTDNGARWITEAHRHGWEISSHLPYNVEAPSITPEELDTLAQESLDAVRQATGQDKVQFVYPRHARTPETDRILSKYYSRGRGRAMSHVYPRGGGGGWLTTALPADDHLEGTVSESLKATLRQVAASDGQVVLYLHYTSITADARDAGLRELVPFIRSLGMDIRNPGQVWGETQVVADPYDEEGAWNILQGAERVSTDAYHGATSVRLSGTSSALQTGTAQVTPKGGMFTVMRLSYRVKTDGFTVSGQRQGVRVQVAETMRTLDGEEEYSTNYRFGDTLPAVGTTQGAMDWVAVRQFVYLQPSTIAVTPFIGAYNITDGDLLIDEVKLDFVEHTPALSYTGNLLGTGTSFVSTTVPRLDRCDIRLQPVEPMAGFLSYEFNQGSRLILRSTVSTDRMAVRVTVTPGPSYYDMSPRATGA